MLELGERAAQIHQRVGQQVASADIDLVIGVGELGSVLATAAGEVGRASVCFD
jgi:UDP-N-acetylmuramyl pentapeptide synthase